MNVILLTDGVLNTYKGKKHIETEEVFKGDSFWVDRFWSCAEEEPTTFKVFMDCCTTYKAIFSGCEFIIKNEHGELLYTFINGEGKDIAYQDRYNTVY